jgi:hypothetical protein
VKSGRRSKHRPANHAAQRTETAPSVRTSRSDACFYAVTSATHPDRAAEQSAEAGGAPGAAVIALWCTSSAAKPRRSADEAQ